MGRPSKPLISRSAATSAALEVIDESGLHAFSVGAVAKRMGVKAPSLYYHFADRAELLSEVAKSILAKTEVRMDRQTEWKEQAVKVCLAARRAVLRHPNAAPLMLQFFPRHLLLNAYEISVSNYPAVPRLHMAIIEGLERITFGSALFAAAAEVAGGGPLQVDPKLYPHFSESMSANPFDDEQLFLETLNMFLEGAEARIERALAKAA